MEEDLVPILPTYAEEVAAALSPPLARFREAIAFQGSPFIIGTAELLAALFLTLFPRAGGIPPPDRSPDGNMRCSLCFRSVQIASDYLAAPTLSRLPAPRRAVSLAPPLLAGSLLALLNGSIMLATSASFGVHLLPALLALRPIASLAVLVSL